LAVAVLVMVGSEDRDGGQGNVSGRSQLVGKLEIKYGLQKEWSELSWVRLGS
jgi:hypothetical protein